VCNCLIQFLLTAVLSIEERVFLVEYIFREDNRYADLVQEQFAEKFPETRVPHRNAVRRLIEKFRETGSVLDAERSGRPSELNDKKLLDISDYAAESHKNHCASWRKGNILGLQQHIKRSEKN
jgi:transposase